MLHSFAWWVFISGFSTGEFMDVFGDVFGPYVLVGAIDSVVT